VQRSRSTLPGPRLTKGPIHGLSVAASRPMPYFRPALIDGSGWVGWQMSSLLQGSQALWARDERRRVFGRKKTV
jgi:hypothetical protein